MALHVQYLVNKDGTIAIPPDEEAISVVAKDPRWAGYELREANTLDELDDLRDRLYQQECDRLERDGVREIMVWRDRLKAQRDKLLARANSSECTPYEREFIKLWIQRKDKSRDEMHKKAFTVDKTVCFFEQREMDKPRNAEETLGESL